MVRWQCVKYSYTSGLYPGDGEIDYEEFVRMMTERQRDGAH